MKAFLQYSKDIPPQFPCPGVSVPYLSNLLGLTKKNWKEQVFFMISNMYISKIDVYDMSTQQRKGKVEMVILRVNDQV